MIILKVLLGRLDKIENITDEIINSLLEKITSSEKNENDINLLNGICKGIIRSQYDKVKSLNINAIIYSDINSASTDKITSNNEFADNSSGKVIYFYINDSSHYPFYGKYRESIHDQIYGLVKNI